jgi:hypothetical protein
MKRRTNFESVKVRKSIRRSRLTEGIYGSALMYLKFICIWGIIMAADFLLEFRFEFLWPFWLVLRSIYDSFKYQGLLFSIFFVLIAFLADLTCYILLPVQWLFFAASSYVWIQYVWQTERGICLGTVVLWVLFVWLEASVRLREIKTIDLCRPFAAHCIGYPMVTLGFGFKTYLAYKWRLRKQRDVRKTNESYVQLLQQALPIEVQQEAEKERLSREKGSFPDPYDECVPSGTMDGNYPPSSSSSSSPPFSSQLPSTTMTNTNSSSSANAVAATAASAAASLSTHTLINSQSQSSSSSFCTMSKRSSKSSNSTNDETFLSSAPSSLVQSNSTLSSSSSSSSSRTSKVQTTTTTTNGHDDELSSSYKQQKQNLLNSAPSLSNLNTGGATSQQKKQQQQQTKSAAATNGQQTTTQSRRQQKKQEQREQIPNTSRDSSSSHVNGFAQATENSDIEKSLQISKLESDVQRLNQTIDKQKSGEMQLRAQITELKNVRKDLDDLRADNSALQTKYDSMNTQRQRDKQRVADLERNLNDERQTKQRFESQIKAEKTLTKKLQDDLSKLTSAPAKSECTELVKWLVIRNMINLFGHYKP